MISNNQSMNRDVSLNSIGKKYVLKRGTVSQVYDEPDEIWVLKNISISIKAGAVCGIIGRNGAGKTTLLNIIAGVMVPSEGEVQSPGKVLGLFNLGVGFQDELSGRDNIYLNGAILGASRKELESRIEDIIIFSELGGFIDMPLGSYSQGMRLRLGFSIIANLDFDVFVLDEVLAVGDALFQNKCFERLMEFKRKGKTFVISSQDMALVERLCDTVALLDHGMLVFHGSPQEALSRYRNLLSTERFYVGAVPRSPVLVENTKKWTDDAGLWGTKLGTKEVEIERVAFLNRFGFNVNSVKPGQRLLVKVWFRAKNTVRDPHFGVAIFRQDGVYCYGPNTAFDGYRIPEIKKGIGYFTLNFTRLFLQPGAYRVSVAIWDKNETLAYDYHNGYYRLIVTGKAEAGSPLIRMPFTEKTMAACGQETSGIRMENVFSDKKNIFFTGKPCQINLIISKQTVKKLNKILLCGIYRDDGIYCQGFFAYKEGRCVSIKFDRLFLLPGKYHIRFNDQLYPFHVVSDHYDHGTVYLEHMWRWKKL
jgi:lipopolysaccharide transport system ATP-binding protein